MNRDSIFSSATPAQRGPFDVTKMRDYPTIIRPPTPDDVEVGIDGSTADAPRKRPEIAGEAHRNTPLHVYRVDTVRNGATIDGHWLKVAGCYFLEIRFREAAESRKLVTAEHLAQVAAATKQFNRDAAEWFLEKNGADPDHPGWPLDAGFGFAQIGMSIPGHLHQMDRKFSLPAFYSVRYVRTLEKPVTAHNTMLDTAQHSAASLEALRTLAETNAALLAELKAARESTKEGSKSR